MNRFELTTKALAKHLQPIKFILSKEKVAELQKLTIWVEADSEGGPFVRAELKQHDPRMFRLQEKIWGKIR